MVIGKLYKSLVVFTQMSFTKPLQKELYRLNIHRKDLIILMDSTPPGFNCRQLVLNYAEEHKHSSLYGAIKVAGNKLCDRRTAEDKYCCNGKR